MISVFCSSQASMELWIAARTDQELRASLAPVDRELARHVQEIARAFLGPALDETRFRELFWLTVNLARGLAIDEILDGSPTRRSALITAWRDLARGSIPQR